MRSIRSFLVVLVGVPLVLMVMLAALLPLVSWHATNDPERRASVAAWLSAFTQGDITLTGPVRAQVFPWPKLTLSGARLDVDRHAVHTSVAVDGATLAATLDGFDLGWTLVLRQPEIRVNASRSTEAPD
ncbi:MAG: hypothetical protein JO055_00600, partial [Alphaproteobacteria bacterium]|nr:hypothetical protein [Alphaproteobacteria bacterium]